MILYAFGVISKEDLPKIMFSPFFSIRAKMPVILQWYQTDQIPFASDSDDDLCRKGEENWQSLHGLH